LVDVMPRDDDDGPMVMPPGMTWVHGCWIAPTDALLIMLRQGMGDDVVAQDVMRALSKVKRDLQMLIRTREALDDPEATVDVVN
jgi:hypothetical protein